MAVTALTDFFGWTEAQLLAALLKAQNDLASGKTISAAGSGEVSKQNLVQQNALERIKRIRNALYELYLQDAVTYAAYANFSDEQITESRAIFGNF
jgi:hypothetical protein